MSEKILIISYLFPPSAGIGGRRWAKIAKHWLIEGNDVEVIASYNKKDSKGPWDKDIKSLSDENRIIYTKIYYPDILNSFSQKSLLGEMHYRLALNFVKASTKGNYYDRSIFWAKHLKKIVEKKIKEGFTNIVATGAPFYYLKDIVNLKDKYPNVKVWIDLRDPWSWGKGYGMAVLSAARINYEEGMEKSILDKADLITVPIQKMLNHLKEKYPNNKNLKILPHFYDPEDLPKYKKREEKPEIDLIYAGTIYEGTQSTIKIVADQLVKLSNAGNKVKWTFYVAEPKKLKVLSNNTIYNEVIKINGFIPSDEILSRIARSDHYIAIYPEKFKDHLSTKFPELYSLNSSLIYIGKNGEISDFILENDMGITIDPSEIELKFNQLIMNKREFEIKNRDKFSVKTIIKSSFSVNLI